MDPISRLLSRVPQLECMCATVCSTPVVSVNHRAPRRVRCGACRHPGVALPAVPSGSPGPLRIIREWYCRIPGLHG